MFSLNLYSTYTSLLRHNLYSKFLYYTISYTSGQHQSSPRGTTDVNVADDEDSSRDCGLGTDTHNYDALQEFAPHEQPEMPAKSKKGDRIPPVPKTNTTRFFHRTWFTFHIASSIWYDLLYDILCMSCVTTAPT